jgi:hypothetical protein
MHKAIALGLGLVVALLIGPAVAGEAAAPAPGPPSAPAAPAAPAATKAAPAPASEVTLAGMLGCGKCSFHMAKACENVLKVKAAKAGAKDEVYLLADNAVSRANHEKVCGPASPATVTGTVARKGRKKILTASAIKFD